MKKRYLRLVRRTFRALRHRRLRDRPWWQALTRPLFQRTLWMPCRDTVAMGISIGLFFSMIPMIPQALFSAIVSMRAKANVPFSMAACFISNPASNFVIWPVQARLGRWLHDAAGFPVPEFFLRTEVHIPRLGMVDVGSFFLGSVASGLILALCAYPLVHLFSAILPHHLPVRRGAMKVSQPRKLTGQTGTR